MLLKKFDCCCAAADKEAGAIGPGGTAKSEEGLRRAEKESRGAC